jgi:hypothetical protein
VHALTPPFELDDRANAIATALANADSGVVGAILAFSCKTSEPSGYPRV